MLIYVHVLIDGPKGRQDVNFPLDDYFMALAVLATTRSPFTKKVLNEMYCTLHILLSFMCMYECTVYNLTCIGEENKL